MDRQIRRLGVALMALFAVLFLQLNRIQVVDADKLADDPRNTRKIIRDFSRERGEIISADGAVVARSVPVDGAFDRLRQYPEAELFAHVTGYFSFTFGTDGAERTFNDALAGRDLRIRRLRDVLTDRTVTNDVTLTITKGLQEVARDALGNRKGAVVALNPTDGAVLAMWSFPSFDPNVLAAHDQSEVQAAWAALIENGDKPLEPRAYRRSYAPGSTFKVVTAAAALEQAPELVSKPYPVERQLDLPQTTKDLPNFGGSACGGTLTQLLRVSCNTGFARVGLDLGPDKLVDAAEAFGFDARPPLDLPAVAASNIPELDELDGNPPALAQSAIGQRDVSATALQMALVAAGIGNGGLVMRPHVLQEIRDDEGNVVRRHEPDEWKQAMTPEGAAALRDMMVTVVRSGTATRVALPGISVAAKTGTAQTIGDNSHAWMIAFAPAEAPRVAVAVIVESQPGLGDTVTGGRIAAPIAKAVLQAALASP